MKCSSCGKEENVHNMIEIYTGRVQYLCWECYKWGHGEAHLTEIDRAKRMNKWATDRNRKK